MSLIVVLNIPQSFDLADNTGRENLAEALAKAGVEEVKSQVSTHVRQDEQGNQIGMSIYCSLLALTGGNSAVLATRDVSANSEDDVEFLGRAALFQKEYKDALEAYRAREAKRAELEAMSPEERKAYKEARRAEKEAEKQAKAAAKAEKKAAEGGEAAETTKSSKKK